MGSRRNVRWLHDRQHQVDTFTLTGDLDLVWRNPAALGQRRIVAPTFRYDCGGSARNVDLPPAASSAGVRLKYVNTSDAAETATLRDSTGATTVVAVDQNEEASLWCDGTAWYGHVTETT